MLSLNQNKSKVGNLLIVKKIYLNVKYDYNKQSLDVHLILIDTVGRQVQCVPRLSLYGNYLHCDAIGCTALFILRSVISPDTVPDLYKLKHTNYCPTIISDTRVVQGKPGGICK